MLVNKLKDKDKNKGRKQDRPKTTTAKVWLAEAHKRKSGEEKGRKEKGTICAVVRPEDNETTPRARRADEPVPASTPVPPFSGAFDPPYSLYPDLSGAEAAGGESPTPVTPAPSTPGGGYSLRSLSCTPYEWSKRMGGGLSPFNSTTPESPSSSPQQGHFLPMGEVANPNTQNANDRTMLVYRTWTQADVVATVAGITSHKDDAPRCVQEISLIQ